MKTCWPTLIAVTLCLAASSAWAGSAGKHTDPDVKKKAHKAETASAPVTAWRIDKGTVSFTATQLGQPFTGKFGTLGGDLVLDPANLDQARLTATVDTGSVDAGDAQRNAALPGEDWFDVAHYPKATFKSGKFVHKDGRSYEVTGKLSIKGIERQVTIPFTLTPNGDTAIIKGGFDMKRTDFGVGEGQWASGQWIGLDVKVTIDALAAKAAP
jgi:polyisoprenoid-binding protein YceI